VVVPADGVNSKANAKKGIAFVSAAADGYCRSHDELSHDWTEIESLLERLGPAWAEVRPILNELNRALGEL
jgi:hypothetical protein